jgi:hypothetical protein
MFLFVQLFSGGTLVPKANEPDIYTLTLNGAVDQTVYFSDRPERIVGTAPMGRFLNALGFTPDNPPNAALLAQTDSGEEIVVVELFNPVFTQGFGDNETSSLMYDVRILDAYEEEGLAHLAQRRQGEDVPSAFGTASLFIDDCRDSTIVCYHHEIARGQFGPVGFCWSFGDICCKPCGNSDIDYWQSQCNANFPACENDCVVRYWYCV